MDMKKSRLTTAIVATCCAAMLPAFAYAADEQKAERVEVVGSHIKRTDIEGALPVVSITRDDIEKSGYNNLQQLFEKLPYAGNGTFSTRGNNQDSTANGAAAVSLRGLGADATLVLLNGRRVSFSPFAENIANTFVDINNFPMSAIERVDILKDGASAIYGSDAIAGVINIITRKDFDGMEVSVGYGNTTDTDNDEKVMSAIWGVNGDNSNMTLIVDYFSNSALHNKDRGKLGTANQAPFGGFDFRSSRGFPGYFVVNGQNTVDPACPADRIRGGGTVCVYDYGPWNLLTPESERVGALLQGNKSYTNIEVFTEISLQHNTSNAQGAPTPLDEDAQLTVPGSHPNNPWAQDIGIGRYRTVDAGARQWDIESDNLRMLLGLRGTWGDWDWEVAGQKARSSAKQSGGRHQGWVRTDFLQREIDAGRYNPFGGTINPQSVIENITTSLVRTAESHLTSIDAKTSGPLFDMSGGQAMLAVGAEYRDEDARDTPDDQFQRGLIFGTESVSASAKRDVTSAFAEINLPFTDTFNTQIALRQDSYDEAGSSTNPKVGFDWRPIDDLMLRASWATGFRAPSLAQVGLGPSQESAFLTDTAGCANNPTLCAPTDYTFVFTGNTGLDPEESESWNIGLVWQVADNASMTVDVWNIEHTDKIDKVPNQDVFAANCSNPNSTVCVRLAPPPGFTFGPISRIFNTYVNISSQEASGVDLSADYRLDMTDMGAIKFNFNWSYLSKFEKDGFDWAGKYEYPEIRWTTSAEWQLENWGILGLINYIGEFDEQLRNDKVDAFATLNLQTNYTGFANTVLTFGIDNALDEEPPYSAGDGDSDLYGYVSSQHSPRGQFVYGKVTYRF